MGFTIDGAETKVRLDFGCGVIDYRGLFRNGTGLVGADRAELTQRQP